VITRPGSGAYRAHHSAGGAGALDTSWQQIALTAGEQQPGEPAPCPERIAYYRLLWDLR
jgi:hypothetical protein